MRKYTTVLFLCFIFSTAFSQRINFPESFKFDNAILEGAVHSKIDDELRKEHIFANPAVITDEMGIRRRAERMDSKNIDRVYYEIFTDLKDKGNAGVIVYEFNSVKNLQKVLPSLYEQSNYVILIANNYLIQVWNDSRDKEKRLRKAVIYYKNKVNAKKVFLQSRVDNQLDSTTVAVDVAAEEVVDPVAEVAADGTLYNIGFGRLSSDLVSDSQSRNLQNYAQKFEDSYQTEIAVGNIGKSDLSDDMIPGYASHLVFDDQERINNNIVILIDEVKNKSYFYFGTKNHKIFKKLALEKMINDLNSELAAGTIYHGLNAVLEEFEIALIEASGQSAKVKARN